MKKFLHIGIAIVLAGCSDNKSGFGPNIGAGYEKQLKAIGIAYHDYFGKFNRGPANANELGQFLTDAKALEALKSGDIVFIWNVGVLEMSVADGATNTILAYEKQTPSAGGIVLFGDGRVDQLGADDFKKATVAKPKGR